MLEILTKEEFNKFADNHELGIFFQSSYWGELKKETGWNSHLVGIKEDNKIVGASLLLAKKIPVFNKYIFYSPRGFLIDYNNLDFVEKYVKEVKKYVKENNGIFLKINPLVKYQDRDINGDIKEEGTNNFQLVEKLKQLDFKHTGLTITYGKDLEPRWISVLDLKNKTEEDIFKKFRSTYRRKIKHSMDGCLNLELLENNIDAFEKIMCHTGERRGFLVRPIQYYTEMNKLFNKHIKNVVITLDIPKKIQYIENQILIEKDDERKNKLILNKNELIQIQKECGDKLPLTCGVFLLYGNEVTYLYGGSIDKYMKYLGPYYMQWEMIKLAINNGYEKYNFYGITGEFNEDSEMFGLFDFKRGFGAEVNELIGEFTLVVNKFYYVMYKLMFKVYKILKRRGLK